MDNYSDQPGAGSDPALHARLNLLDPNPLIHLREILNVVILAFVITKVIVYENFVIVSRSVSPAFHGHFHNLNYLTPILGIGLLVIIFMIYEYIIFARPSNPKEIEKTAISPKPQSSSSSDEPIASGTLTQPPLTPAFSPKESVNQTASQKAKLKRFWQFISKPFLIDIAALLFCLAALQSFNSGLQLAPDDEQIRLKHELQNSLVALSNSIHQLTATAVRTQNSNPTTYTPNGLQSVLATQSQGVSTNFAKVFELQLSLAHEWGSDDKYCARLASGCISAVIFFLAIILRLRRMKERRAMKALEYDYIGLCIVALVGICYFFRFMTVAGVCTMAGALALIFYSYGELKGAQNSANTHI
jgi:hypothetical protein